MIARVQKRMQEREAGDQGFTLIELLVVIIIIGILAAIAIPAFLNQREKAWASQVESDLKNASIAAESYAVGNNGSYADLDFDALVEEGYNKTADVTVEVQNPTADSYTLVGTHDRLDAARTFTYDSTTGVIVDSED